jgi:hypothetical protein
MKIMDEIKETGGAKIGMANVTWPFATLTVTKDTLELNASIIGNLVFQPTDIISIEPHSSFLSSGLKINHSVPNYKDEVIFWTFGNVNYLLLKIEQIGFLNRNAPISDKTINAITSSQLKGGFPIKKWFANTVLAIWSLLLLYDFTNSNTEGLPVGIGFQSALGIIFGIGVLLLISDPFRQLILKEGRTLDDIKKFVYFLLFISGIMLLQFILMF